MGTSAYLLRKYAPASVAYRDPGKCGAKRAESTIPEIFLAPRSGQRDVRVFASQIRTGCGRLSATLPARYKRFAFI